MYEKLAQKLQQEWSDNPRWRGVKRNYSALDVIKLQGSLVEDYTLAKHEIGRAHV